MKKKTKRAKPAVKEKGKKQTAKPSKSSPQAKGVGKGQDPSNNGRKTAPGQDPKTGRFVPGNKLGGKKPGSRNKVTRVMLQRFTESQDQIASQLVALATKGDVGAARLIVDRLLGKMQDQPVQWEWCTQLETIEDVQREYKQVLRGISTGQLTPNQGEALRKMLDGYRESIQEAALQDHREAFLADERVIAKIRSNPKAFRAAVQLVRLYHQLLDESDWQQGHSITALPLAVAAGKPN